ncbi:MAG: DUF7711 family protein [Egibacteraceae bacterium]
MMEYGTAVEHLRRVAAACDRYFGRTTHPLCVGAYAYGELIEGAARLESASVVFALDLPPEEVPWGIESREVRGFVQHFIRVPLRWSCRPAAGPIATPEIQRPVRFWSLDGVDEDVLDALAGRRFDQLPVVPDPDPADLAAELGRTLRHLRTVVDRFWEPGWRREHKGGGVYPEQHLWNAAWAYLQMLEPLSPRRDTGEPDANVPGWDRDAIARLREAVDQTDGDAVLAALEDRPLSPVLQLAGDGLLAALAQGCSGEAEAAACVAGLRAREWTGDDVLADGLDRLLAASPPAPALEPVPVDLAVLAFHLDQSEASADAHHLHLLTGQIEPASPPRRGRGAAVDAEVLRIEPQGSHEAYWDMKEFTATVAERSLRQLLDVALGGRGAFRRFREVLSAYPEERERWTVFSGERARGRARAWLATKGYRPATKRP